MVAQWLRYCVTNRKVAGSIPDGVIGIFHWHNPSDRTMALGSTQPLTEMSTGIFPGGKGWQPYHHPVPSSCNLGTLTTWNPLGHSMPLTGLIYLLLTKKERNVLFDIKMAHLWRHVVEMQWDNNTINSQLMLRLKIKNPNYVQHQLLLWPTFVLDSVPSGLIVSSCFHLLDGNNSHELLLRVQKFSELTPWGMRTENSDWFLSTQRLNLVIYDPGISSLTVEVSSCATRALLHKVTHV
jgi:hypothetical protein